jgi:Tol biopolymer transport system component
MKTRVVAVDPDTGHIRTLPISGTQDYVSVPAPQPVWSPDGSSVAYVFSHRLRVLDLATGRSRSLVWCDSCGLVAPAWSPDGSTLALAQPLGGIDLIDVRNPSVRSLYPSVTRQGLLSGLSWSPDGHRIAFIAESRPGHTELYTVRTDRTDVRALAGDAVFSSTWSPDGSKIAYLVSPGSGGGCDPVRCPILVKEVDADGSAPTTVLRTGRFHYFSWRGGLAWSPDGKEFALTLPSGLFVVSSDGTDLRLLMHGAYGQPSWRPVA